MDIGELSKTVKIMADTCLSKYWFEIMFHVLYDRSHFINQVKNHLCTSLFFGKFDERAGYAHVGGNRESYDPNFGGCFHGITRTSRNLQSRFPELDGQFQAAFRLFVSYIVVGVDGLDRFEFFPTCNFKIILLVLDGGVGFRRLEYLFANYVVGNIGGFH